MPEDRTMQRTDNNDPDVLQREIEDRRRDLAWSIGELSTLIRETLSPRLQARRAMYRTRLAVRSHPGTFVAIAAAVSGILAVLGFLWGRRAVQRVQYLRARRRHPVAAEAGSQLGAGVAKVRRLMMTKGANGTLK